VPFVQMHCLMDFGHQVTCLDRVGDKAQLSDMVSFWFLSLTAVPMSTSA
jgi:hypothetical protein